jgi:hypothetical protein
VCSFSTDASGELIDTILEFKLSKKNSPRIKMTKKIVPDILNLEDGMPKLYQTAVTKNLLHVTILKNQDLTFSAEKS